MPTESRINSDGCQGAIRRVAFQADGPLSRIKFQVQLQLCFGGSSAERIPSSKQHNNIKDDKNPQHDARDYCQT